MKAVAPQPRPATPAARPAAPAKNWGAPAVTSPVRRVAPPPRPVAKASRTAARSTGTAAKPATGTLTGLLDQAGKLAATKLTAGPVGRVGKVTAGPVGRVAEVTSPVTGPATGPVGQIAKPVGQVLGPVTGGLAGAVGGLVPPVVPGGLLPLPGLPGFGSQDGPSVQGPAATFTGVDGAAPGATVPASFETIPARPAADGASSPAARSTRSWPALTGAVSLPGFPASAELPAGGPDPLSTSSGAGLALVALVAALLPIGLTGRGRARPDRSGVLSRSYLPAVSPA